MESDKVKELINKAAATQDSNEAMKFSQAALNAANALIALVNVEKQSA